MGDKFTKTNASDVRRLSFRPFRGKGDYLKIIRIFNNSQEQNSTAKLATIKSIANQYKHLVNCDPYQDVIFAELDGKAIGYSRCWWLQEIGGARLYIHTSFLPPSWRESGIQQAMLHHNENRLRTVSATHPQNGYRYLQCWASETETSWQKVFQDASYQIARYSMRMMRPNLNAVLNVPTPRGIEIRRGTLAEWRQIWEAAREAFRDHWGEVAWKEEDFLQASNDPSFNPDLWQIAWDGDEVAGGVLNFINIEENEVHDRLRGYTETVFVRRPWRQQGVAHALLANSFKVLKEEGITEAALDVDAENSTGAVKLYTDMGFQVIEKSATYRKLLDF